MTPLGQVVIRAAAAGDVPGAREVLRAAAQRLVERGEALWTPDDFTPEFLVPLVNAGELHVALEGGEVVGVFTVQGEDPVFWPDVPAGEALYLHNSVRPDRAGRGLAQAMPGFALGLAHAQGRAFLRLNCAPRPKLCAVYEGFGFHRRERALWRGGGFDVVRYEMRAGGHIVKWTPT